MRLRGSGIGLVPQDPMTNLNPVLRIGTQVKEALKANNVVPSSEIGARVAALLEEAPSVGSGVFVGVMSAGS